MYDFYCLLKILPVVLHKIWAINEGATSNGDQVYTSPFPRGGSRQKQKNFALVISKN